MSKDRQQIIDRLLAQGWAFEGDVGCAVCPRCAFTFDAGHEDNGGGWSCANCETHSLQEWIMRLLAAEADVHDAWLRFIRWLFDAVPGMADRETPEYDQLVALLNALRRARSRQTKPAFRESGGSMSGWMDDSVATTRQTTRLAKNHEEVMGILRDVTGLMKRMSEAMEQTTALLADFMAAQERQTEPNVNDTEEQG